MSQTHQDPLLTKQETAALLKVSLRTLDRWREEGLLVPADLGQGIRSVRYRRADLERFITGRQASA